MLPIFAVRHKSLILIINFKHVQKPEFSWSDDKISLLLCAIVKIKVEEDYIDVNIFLPFINEVRDNVICKTVIYADIYLYSAMWQQLELVSELESDLRDTVDWGKTWIVDFNAGKIQLVSFDRPNNTSVIDVKIDRYVLEER